jgi:hypothetical protein
MMPLAQCIEIDLHDHHTMLFKKKKLWKLWIFLGVNSTIFAKNWGKIWKICRICNITMGIKRLKAL